MGRWLSCVALIAMAFVLLGGVSAAIGDEADLARLRAENEALRAKVAQLEAKLASSQAEMAKLRAMSEDLKQHAKQAEAKAADVQKQHQQLMAEAKQAQQVRAKAYVQRGYDDAADRTIVGTRHRQLKITHGSAAEHWVSMDFEHPGRTLDKAPASVRFRLETAFSGSRYRDVDAIELLVDGAAATMKVIDYERKKRTTVGRSKRDISDESLMAELSVADLAKIAGAKEVTGSIGPVRFAFDADLIEAARVLMVELQKQP